MTKPGRRRHRMNVTPTAAKTTGGRFRKDSRKMKQPRRRALQTSDSSDFIRQVDRPAHRQAARTMLNSFEQAKLTKRRPRRQTAHRHHIGQMRRQKTRRGSRKQRSRRPAGGNWVAHGRDGAARAFLGPVQRCPGGAVVVVNCGNCCVTPTPQATPAHNQPPSALSTSSIRARR